MQAKVYESWGVHLLGCLPISGGGGMRLAWPLFCEKVGLYGIPVGFRGRAVSGAGGGDFVFHSPVVWLAAVVLFSSLILFKTVAEGGSSSTMCFGGGAGYWFLQQQQHELTPFGKIGGGFWLAVLLLLRRAGDQWRGVPVATGSFW